MDITLFFIMLIAFMISIFSGYYMFAAMGGLGVIFGYLFWGPAVFNMLYFKAYSTASDYTLLAIPLFVFMGTMLDKSGIAEKVFEKLAIAMGGFKGGMAVACMVISILFAATTGLVGASVVTMGLLFLPAMLRYKYDRSFASGVVASGGTLGILIPPSIMLVVMGNVSNISVAKLFYGAMVPGVFLGLSYIVYIIVFSYLKPNLAPPMPAEERAGYTTVQKLTGVLVHVMPVLVIILAVLGTIWLGIAPPTEASAVGSMAAIIIALIYRRLSYKVLMDTLRESVIITGMLYMMIVFSSFFVAVFMRLGGSKIVADAITGLPFGAYGALFIMLFIIFLLGFLMDWLGAVFIVLPVFVPIAASLGFDPLWFIIVIAVVFQTSFLTPPVAFSIFYLKGVAPPEVTLRDIIRGSVPFIIIQLVVMALCIIFPEIITWLPNLRFK